MSGPSSSEPVLSPKVEQNHTYLENPLIKNHTNITFWPVTLIIIILLKAKTFRSLNLLNHQKMALILEIVSEVKIGFINITSTIFYYIFHLQLQ